MPSMVTMLADTIADIAKGVSASRYLERLLTAKPALADEVAASLKAPVTKAELSGWLSDRQANRVMSEADLKPLLREFKQWAYARIATRDLANLAPLDEVMETMTCIAELAINQAVGVLMHGLVARYGVPRNAAGEAQQLIVIGMGKLGGRELNVSSDIDLIFVYPDDGETDGIMPACPAAAASVSTTSIFHPPGTQPDQCHCRDHRRRPGLPRRHAPAAEWRFRPAGVQLRHAGKLLHHPGSRMGALCLDQGAAA
jgi:glutamine synthetase adenylyltransferase